MKIHKTFTQNNYNKYVIMIYDQLVGRCQLTSGGWIASVSELRDGEYIRSFNSRELCDKHIKHYKNACSWGINNRSEWWAFCDDGLGAIVI